MAHTVLRFKRIQMEHEIKATTVSGAKMSNSPIVWFTKNWCKETFMAIDFATAFECDDKANARACVWVNEMKKKFQESWFNARLREHFNFRLVKANTLFWEEEGESHLVSINVQDKSLQYLMVRHQKFSTLWGHARQRISFIRCYSIFTHTKM